MIPMPLMRKWVRAPTDIPMWETFPPFNLTSLYLTTLTLGALLVRPPEGEGGGVDQMEQAYWPRGCVNWTDGR